MFWEREMIEERQTSHTRQIHFPIPQNARKKISWVAKLDAKSFLKHKELNRVFSSQNSLVYFRDAVNFLT